MKSGKPEIQIALNNSSIKPGQKVEIHSLCSEGVLGERLHEMGLKIGMTLMILGKAPFAGPLLIRFKTSFLALRNEEASCVTVILR